MIIQVAGLKDELKSIGETHTFLPLNLRVPDTLPVGGEDVGVVELEPLGHSCVSVSFMCGTTDPVCGQGVRGGFKILARRLLICIVLLFMLHH